MPAAGGIGVGQFIDQDDRRLACQGAIEVEFRIGGTAIRRWQARQHFETGQ
jgi:hypothetical protein